MRSLVFGFFALLFCFSFLLAQGQEKLPDFGKADMAELLLKEYSLDKNAAAINLLKTAEVNFSLDPYWGGTRTVTQYRVRIKIFDEKAFNKASISIPYIDNSRTTRITDVDAYIFNIAGDGKVVSEKLDKSQIFKDKGKGKKVYNSIRFTFPGLTRGSVIEYRYTKIDKNTLSLQPWFFQDALPTRLSKCSVTIPQLVAVRFRFVNSQPIEKDSSGREYFNSIANESKQTFTMRDVPAFKAENMMTSFKDNLQRLEFIILPKTYFSFKIDDVQWRMYNGMLLTSSDFGKQIIVAVS